MRNSPVDLLLAVSVVQAVFQKPAHHLIHRPALSRVGHLRASAPASDGLYCLNVKVCVKPERREEFLKCIEANQRGTLSTEPRAVTYLYGEDEATSNTFHFFEQYRGREGFEEHTRAPHFAVWEKFVATDPFTEPPLVTFFTQRGTGIAYASSSALLSKLRTAGARTLVTGSSLGGIIGANLALRQLFAMCAIRFPSPLAGMLLLFGGMCTAQALSPALASRLEAALAPGCTFISRWLALFFVPNLVVLPLVLSMSPFEAARLLLVIVGGLACSIPLAALVAVSALPKASPGATAAAKAPVEASPAASGSAVLASQSPSPLRTIVAASTLSGLLAIGANRLVGGLVARVLAFVHLLTCTVCGYVAGQKVVPVAAQKIVHPLITCTLSTLGALAAFAAATGQPFRPVLRSYLVPGGAAFTAPGNLLLFMLGPATLSFGFQMFGRRRLMAESSRAISAATAASAIFGLFGTAVAGRLLSLPLPVRLAALSRQVTAPLAIEIAKLLAADPSLAATIVVLTGLLAANFGRVLLDALQIDAPVARGLAMGTAGHGVGTAAMASEKEAFPFAAIGMALNAAVSTVLVSVPAVRRLLLAVAGAPVP